MKKLLNTLYITSPNKYLALDGETILVKEEDKKVVFLVKATIVAGY